MHQFKNKIQQLSSIYNTCQSLSSITKYKYINYTNKVNFLQNIENNILNLCTKSKKKGNICLLITNFFSSNSTLNKIINKYEHHNCIIICDFITTKKIQKQIDPNINIYSFINKKIKQFKTNIYEATLLKKIYNKINNLIEKKQYTINIYYQYKFIKTYNIINIHEYDNNSYQTNIDKIVIAKYLNKMIASLCLIESHNLDQALKNIQIQIKKEKQAYKNHKNKQDLFNLTKFHI